MDATFQGKRPVMVSNIRLTFAFLFLGVCLYMLSEIIFHDNKPTKPMSGFGEICINSSLDITFGMLQKTQVRLPTKLPNFKSHCWLEDYPPNFSYKESFYYRHDCQGREQVVRQFDAMERIRLSAACPSGSACRRLRCFPHFFLIGAPKSGTTDLHAVLSPYHPHIVPGSRKESQFWARRRHGITSSQRCPQSRGISATFAEYLDLYDLASVKIQNVTSDKAEQHPAITGDFTPDDMHYLWDWQAMPGNEGLSEPRVTLAHQLHHLAPETRIIMILRDPVERFLSHMYFTRKDKAASVLALQAKLYVSRFQRCLSSHSLRYCAYSNHSPLVQGIYIVFVQDWLSVFPKDRVLIIPFDEYRKSRLTVLQRIAKFLDLNPNLCRNSSSVLRREVRLKTQNKGSMPNITLSMLRDFYRPYNQELARLLGDSRYTWT